ncbi:hypothetical protein GCM10009086_01190 [Pseudomonas rhodesiae]
MIAGGLREQVDTGLVDGEPFGTSQFLADIIVELRYGYIGHCVSPWFIGFMPGTAICLSSGGGTFMGDRDPL